MDYKRQGLFQKYAYERADGKPLDDTEAVFALRYDKDDAWGAACRASLRDFADRIEKLGYVQLAHELRSRISAVEARIAEIHATARSLPVL